MLKELTHMSTYFTIGEIASMYNLSIQTLRHYDKIGLLHPAFTNPSTGYRYYSIQQFVKIDFIKHGKALGMTLDEIKELLEIELDLNVLSNLLHKQKLQIEQKMAELNEIEQHINHLQSRLSEVQTVTLNTPILKTETARHFVRYHYVSKNEVELEINIRNVILDIETKYGRHNSELVFEANYDILKQENRVQYEQILVRLLQHPSTCINSTLEAGTYATLFYDDHYGNNTIYYKQLHDFITKHNLTPLSDFYEFVVLPRIDQDGIEKSITQLQVLIKKS